MGEVGPWWFPRDVGRNTKVAWRGHNEKAYQIGAYVAGIGNPQPEKAIREIHFASIGDEGVWAILGVTLSDAPVYFPPPREGGFPSAWGAAECLWALMEGMAGIQNEGLAFDRARLSPRWQAAGINRARATAKLECSGGYVSYDYRTTPDSIDVTFTSNAETIRIELLVPAGKEVRRVLLNGQAMPAKTRIVRGSHYALAQADGVRAHRLQVDLG